MSVRSDLKDQTYNARKTVFLYVLLSCNLLVCFFQISCIISSSILLKTLFLEILLNLNKTGAAVKLFLCCAVYVFMANVIRV